MKIKLINIVLLMSMLLNITFLYKYFNESSFHFELSTMINDRNKLDIDLEEYIVNLIKVSSKEEALSSNPVYFLSEKEKEINVLRENLFDSCEILIRKLYENENDDFDSYKYAYLLNELLETNISYSTGKGYLNQLYNKISSSNIESISKLLSENHGPDCIKDIIDLNGIIFLPLFHEYSKYGQITIVEQLKSQYST